MIKTSIASWEKKLFIEKLIRSFQKEIEISWKSVDFLLKEKEFSIHQWRIKYFLLIWNYKYSKNMGKILMQQKSQNFNYSKSKGKIINAAKKPEL